MNTLVIDIVIGLIFIYLIYSIFITIVGEMIATWLGMRARMLRQGISNLLTDTKKQKPVKNILVKFIQDFFLFEPLDFKFTTAAKFYEQASIKYLSLSQKKLWMSTNKVKPSYISKQNFSATLLNMLRVKGQGINEWEKIRFAIQRNALHLEPESLDQLKAILMDSNNDFQLFQLKIEQWFDEMMDRVNGWYKRKIQFILFWLGFFIIMVFNVDTFEIVQLLSKDRNARDQMVQMAIAASDSNSMISKAMKTSKDTAVTQDQLKTTYMQLRNDIAESQNILSSRWDYSSLAKQDSLRCEMSPTDSKFWTDIHYIQYLIYKDSLLFCELKLKSDSLKLDSLKYYKNLMSYYNLKLDSNLGVISKLFKKRIKELKSLNFHSNGNYLEASVTIEPGSLQKFGYILSHLSPLKKKFWGFTITALALCLGAPFWFDLLKKLVALRGAGIKPEEKQLNQGNSNQSQNPNLSKSNGLSLTTEDPVEIAIAQNRKYWESLHGLISINKSVITNNGVQTPAVELVVDPTFDKTLVQTPMDIKIENRNVKVPIQFVIGELANFLDSTVANDFNVINMTTGSVGTPTGLVINAKTGKKAVLSCAHVYKSESSYFIEEGANRIECSTRNNEKWELGKVTNLVMSNFIDAAIADTSDAAILKLNLFPIKKFREVSRLDMAKQSAVFIKSGENADIPGKIYHSEKEYIFTDGLHLYKMYNLIMIGNLNQESTNYLTKAGDSGALVVDANQIPIGIIIGGALLDNRHFSFAIKIKDVFEVLQLKCCES
ncbi:MAG: hypothetical protein IPO16_09425 [Saprospiraceae bacterium]|nr:hypothetical protein [Saprospiraceae bacterium]